MSLRSGTERLVFENTVTGLFEHGVEGRLSPGAVQKLKDAGLDLSKPLLPAYPRDVWIQILEIVAADLHPELSPAERMRKLGRLVVAGYKHTLIGKAAAQLAKVVGPKRTLGRMTQNFRSADNWSDTQLTDLGPRQCELSMNDCLGRPSYITGVLEEVLETAGAKEISVVVKSVEADDSCVLAISWS